MGGVVTFPNDMRLPFVDYYRTKCVMPRSSFRVMLEEVTRLDLAM
jgi:hypothetical protein